MTVSAPFVAIVLFVYLFTPAYASTNKSYCGFPTSGHPFTGRICSKSAVSLETCELTRYFTSLPCFWDFGRCTSHADLAGEDFTCINISVQGTCEKSRFNGPRHCVWYEVTVIPTMSPSSHAPSNAPSNVAPTPSPSFSPTTTFPSISPSLVPTFVPTISGEDSRSIMEPITTEPTSVPSSNAPSLSPSFYPPTPMPSQSPTLGPSFDGPTVGICGYLDDPDPWSMDRSCSDVASTKESCDSQIRFVQKYCKWGQGDGNCSGDSTCVDHLEDKQDCTSQRYFAVETCEWYEMAVEQQYHPTVAPSDVPSKQPPTIIDEDGTIRYCGHSDNAHNPFETPLMFCAGSESQDACVAILHYARTICIWTEQGHCASEEHAALYSDPCATSTTEGTCPGTPLAPRRCAWYDSSSHVNVTSFPTSTPSIHAPIMASTLRPTTADKSPSSRTPSRNIATMTPSEHLSLKPSVDPSSTGLANEGTPDEPSSTRLADTDTIGGESEKNDDDEEDGANVVVGMWLFVGLSASGVIVGVLLIKKLCGSSKKGAEVPTHKQPTLTSAENREWIEQENRATTNTEGCDDMEQFFRSISQPTIEDYGV